MKKIFATTVAATLVLGALSATPALAKKKKKKPPTPVTRTITFEESGSMTISGAGVYSVPELEFSRVHECGSMPMSQGLDGYIIEIPSEFGLGTAAVEILGADATGAHDLDGYFYDAGCSWMDGFDLTEGSDPAGAIPAGAKWVVINLSLGANATFDLKATATITE